MAALAAAATQLRESLALASAVPKSAAAPRQVPRLSVVIVNYRQWENTAALVRQVRAEACARRGEVEVMVVDNHSSPHRLIKKLRRSPGVSLRRWGCNRGFARAVNEGCRLSEGPWFLLLNPDVVVTPGFIEQALQLADELDRTEPDAGIVGFRLRNRDGSEQLSAGPFPTLANTLTGLFRPRASRKYRPVRTRKRCRVPWVTGCCLLLRRDCWRDLGGFDESFFLYYEDVDLCHRAQVRGWTVWFEPRLAAVHCNPVHRRKVSPALRRTMRRSLLTYAARHWPAWQLPILAGVVGLEARLRSVAAWWRVLSAAIGSVPHKLVEQARSRLEADLSRTAQPRGGSPRSRASA